MLIHGINFNDGGKMMKKLLKNVLSITLVFALVLSLGVTAFADGTDAKDKDDVEIIDIAFNLCTGDPCAVRMRELGYDDIRLNGISYKADAEDGVIAIHLGDLAAAKLLTEKKDEAEKAGIDFNKIYIRNGKVCVDGDAALSATVNSFMTANKLNVSIGDIFELSNGSELKLKVRVVNFYYPAQSEPETVKVITGEQAEKWMDAEYNKIDTPQITTIYVDYSGSQEYDTNDDGNKIIENVGKRFIQGILCLAKDKGDKNNYYIKKYAEGDKKGTDWAEMKDLTKNSLWDWVLADDTGIFEYDARYAFGMSTGNGDDDVLSYEKATISTDPDKKTIYREFTFTNKTPELADLLNANEKGKDELAKLGYTATVDESGNLILTPMDTTIINQNSSTDYEIVFRNTITVNAAKASETTLALTPPATAPVAEAAPVESEAEAEEPAVDPTEEVVEEEPKEEVVEEVAEEPVEEPKEEVKEEDEEVTEGETDATPAESPAPEAGTTETPTLTQAELDEIERKKKLAEEEAARLAAEAAAAAAATEAPAPTEAAAEIPTDAE